MKIDPLLFENMPAMMRGQPSNDELVCAHNAVIDALPGSLRALAAVRKLRTTWCGIEENKLRRAIDAAIT